MRAKLLRLMYSSRVPGPAAEVKEANRAKSQRWDQLEHHLVTNLGIQGIRPIDTSMVVSMAGEAIFVVGDYLTVASIGMGHAGLPSSKLSVWRPILGEELASGKVAAQFSINFRPGHISTQIGRTDEGRPAFLESGQSIVTIATGSCPGAQAQPPYSIPEPLGRSPEKTVRRLVLVPLGRISR